MKRYRVIFTTYEEYEIEANSREEALNEAERQLENDRCSPIANICYDEREIEEIDDEEQ